MLTSVEVRTSQGALLQLPFDEVTEGNVVEEITGLDPVKANIVSSSFARMDGEQYQASRREKRNIVLTLGLEPDYTTSSVRQLRSRLYGFFMPKSQITLSFISDDEPTVQIVGRVESFDSALFTKDPTVTISILCFDPDFYDPTPVILSGNSTALVQDTLYNYDGSVETGFLFRLLVNRALTTGVTVYNRPPDGIQRSMPFTGSLSAGDVLEISTVPGAKRVSLVRAGTTSSMLYGLSPYSDWLQLFPGDNQFRVAVTGAVIPYTIQYNKKYGGL